MLHCQPFATPAMPVNVCIVHTPALALHLAVFVKVLNINAFAKKSPFPFKRGGP